jgi:L-rhamnose mutarotase
MNYIDELELKSLIIRIKRSHIYYNTLKTSETIIIRDTKSIMDNRKIKKYIKWYIDIKRCSEPTSKHKKVLNDLKSMIIKKSEVTVIDKLNYELFGVYIAEMIDRILTKPQFRNYSYYDDFQSDSVFKILKYIDNFDHTKISKISNQPVNAFSYISQIIHNSIIFIINKNKKYNDFIASQMLSERIKFGASIGNTAILTHCENTKVQKEEAIFSLTDTNINSIIQDISSLDKSSEITVFYYDDNDLDDLKRIYDLRKTFKKLKVVKDER